jgi:lysophospholipase L1-like esterase
MTHQPWTATIEEHMPVRRSIVVALLICLTAPLAPAQEAPATPVKDNDFIAICGDSITEQKLYSVFMEDYVLMCKPKNGLRAAQFGWSGETAPGFLHRMSNVLRFPATVATTAYGMNDAGYSPMTPEKAKAYHDAMNSIVDTFQKSGVHFTVVGSPGAVDTKTFRPTEPGAAAMYNKSLGALREIARGVAAEQKVAFADVYGIMLDVMAKAKAKYGENYDVAGGDGVHPNRNGHLVMAYAFLKALGFDGNIGTITVDLAANKAQASEGHKILSAAGGVIEVESTRYPFCFYDSTDPAHASAGTKQIIEFFPFNQDLNRFNLVVTNTGDPAKKVKVTWGAASKEFAAADLAKGINLSAEFLDNNPFSEPFKKVESAVVAQQTYETSLIKTYLAQLGAIQQMLPEEKETLDKLTAGAMDKEKRLNDAAAAAVTPVKHTIKIELVGAAPAPATPAAAPPAAAPAAAAPAPAAPAPAAPAPAAPAPGAPAPAAPGTK